MGKVWTSSAGRKYTEVKFIGAGGYAKVYEVQGPGGQRFALKHGEGLAEELSFAQQAVERDPHLAEFVVTILDQGEDFVVMRLYQGNLSEYFKSKPGLRRVLEACWRAAECMKALHQGSAWLRPDLDDAGWVHRDIKPHNFLWLEDDHGNLVVRLADMGLFRRIATDHSNTGRGTPPFMSWDAVLRLGPAEPSADVYAMGVSVFWALTGSLPSIARVDENKVGAHLRALTADGMQLYGLWRTGTSDEARRKQLQALPHDRLVDFDRLYSLSTEDRTKLRSLLETQVAAVGGDGPTAHRIADELESSLRVALNPRPGARGTAHDLSKSLAQAITLIGGTETAIVQAVTEEFPELTVHPVVTDPTDPRTPAPVVTPARTAGVVLGALALGGMALVALCALGVVGFALVGSDDDGGDPPPAPVAVDSDGDGVLDRADDCPEIFGLPAYRGCPEPKEPEPDPEPPDPEPPEPDPAPPGPAPGPPDPDPAPPDPCANPVDEAAKLDCASSAHEAAAIVRDWTERPETCQPGEDDIEAVLPWLRRATAGSDASFVLLNVAVATEAADSQRREACAILRAQELRRPAIDGRCPEGYASIDGVCVPKLETGLCAAVEAP